MININDDKDIYKIIRMVKTSKEDIEEFAIMKAEITVLKDNIIEIKESLKIFINKADKMFASNEKVKMNEKKICELKLEFDNYKKSTGSWIRSIVPWIFTFISLALMFYNTF